MDKHHYELLAQIKQRYIDTNGMHPFQVEELGHSVSARQFYLEALADNLVRPMAEQHVAEYSRGSGNELDDKMKALRSSSALTFNMLGNGSCSPTAADDLFRSHEYVIQYEHQLPTLKRGLPANLDAFLTGRDGDVIACEMKMLEWLTSKPSPLKEKYLDADSYRFEDTASAFAQIAAELNASNSFANYDFAQMFKHTLALYNAVRSKELQTDTLTLINCVWEPPADYALSDKTSDWVCHSTKAEHSGFDAFKDAMHPAIGLFDDLGVRFDIRYIPTAELIARLEYPADETQLLKRYL